MISSIVIVTCLEGFKAHLRFKDKKLDRDLAATNKGLLFSLVDSYIYKNVGMYGM